MSYVRAARTPAGMRGITNWFRTMYLVSICCTRSLCASACVARCFQPLSRGWECVPSICTECDGTDLGLSSSIASREAIRTAPTRRRLQHKGKKKKHRSDSPDNAGTGGPRVAHLRWSDRSARSVCAESAARADLASSRASSRVSSARACGRQQACTHKQGETIGKSSQKTSRR